LFGHFAALLTYLGFIETKSASLEALALNISLYSLLFIFFAMIGVDERSTNPKKIHN